jgi:bifunctional DNA-binding transcriptional regulator/antitoxin component of YhaV-PrlF toxin-antitoxin module
MATKSPNTTQERIGRVGQRRQVIIPREMLETLHIQEGDFVLFAQQRNASLSKPGAWSIPMIP